MVPIEGALSGLRVAMKMMRVPFAGLLFFPRQENSPEILLITQKDHPAHA